MIAVRKEHSAFGAGAFRWLEPAPLEIAAYWRLSQDQRILAIHNLSDEEQAIQIPVLPEQGKLPEILLHGAEQAQRGRLLPSAEPGARLTLTPYGYIWLKY